MTDHSVSPALLQLALDDITREGVFSLLERVQEAVDIVEVGTPLLMRYGIAIITDIKERHPDLKVLSDAKIMDAAHYEADLSFAAGADYVTILAVTDNGSVREAVRAARDHGKQIVADMICVTDLPTRAREMADLGVDVLAVHTGVDQQALGRTPLDDLKVLSESGARVPLAVAGGISQATVGDYLPYHPQIIIVGSGIIGADDPAAESARIYRLIKEQRS